MVKRVLGLVLLIVGMGGFLYPLAVCSYFLMTDDGLKTDSPSSLAFAWHQRLHKRYEVYCRDRIRSGVAASLNVHQLEETEWPLFGSCFFLWGTENLQAVWEADRSLSKKAPAVYARGAIEAATALVLDPNHGKWVRDHWGEDYLHHENAFYRMLYVSAICSHHRLTGSGEHLGTLAEMVDSLAHDLKTAEHGLLEDYPDECYPGDVMVALLAVKKADEILGNDRTHWIRDYQKHFIGRLDQGLGLPAYFALADDGVGLDVSRGCANSYVTTFAPELWPSLAETWFERYRKHFWQEKGYAVGFREFGHGQITAAENLDSGPIIDGFGVAATAFGVSACRANGRYDMAYPLTAQMMVASWPIPFRGLLLPNLLSNEHAPLLGEASVVYQLSQRPVRDGEGGGGIVVAAVSGLPWSVYAGFGFYGVLGLVLSVWGLGWIRSRRRKGFTSAGDGSS